MRSCVLLVVVLAAVSGCASQRQYAQVGPQPDPYYYYSAPVYTDPQPTLAPQQPTPVEAPAQAEPQSSSIILLPPPPVTEPTVLYPQDGLQPPVRTPSAEPAHGPEIVPPGQMVPEMVPVPPVQRTPPEAETPPEQPRSHGLFREKVDRTA